MSMSLLSLVLMGTLLLVLSILLIRARAELKTLMQEKMAHLLQIQSLELAIRGEKERSEERLKLFETQKQQLEVAFKAMSFDVLQSNSASFLEMAKGAFERSQQQQVDALKHNQIEVEKLTKPLSEALSHMDHKIIEMEKSRLGAYASVGEQLRLMGETQQFLREETSRLVQALKTPNARGRWGELQLRRVVELAGMLNHCDFYEQATLEANGKRMRPDLLIKLPGNRSVIVDAKAPLTNYLESLQSTDDQYKRASLKLYAEQIRQHAVDLSKRGYSDYVQPSPEFVILFIPGENFYSAALEQDPSLLEMAESYSVVIATPTTLIALLRAIAHGWRQEAVAENAHKVIQLGQTLYKRLNTALDHLNMVGKNLRMTVDAYNESISSIESRALVSARKLQALGVSEPLQTLKSVDSVPKIAQSHVKAGDEDLDFSIKE